MVVRAPECSLVLVVIVAVIVVMTVGIAIMLMVRVVVVLNPTVRSVPETWKVALSVMVRRNPASTFIWWLGPITGVPFIVVSDRIPIAFDPYEAVT